MNELVNIQSICPNIQIDLRYATSDNFTGKVVYDFTTCKILKIAAEKLQQELETCDLGLKIWDAYRPFTAQQKFWELVPDERYVSHPDKGGRHTRGTTVDLTLVNKEGEELPMPSGFDDFSEKAHRDYDKASPEEIENRTLLESLMQSHGFIGLPTEWWHFDLEGWENYPVQR